MCWTCRTAYCSEGRSGVRQALRESMFPTLEGDLGLVAQALYTSVSRDNAHVSGLCRRLNAIMHVESPSSSSAHCVVFRGLACEHFSGMSFHAQNGHSGHKLSHHPRRRRAHKVPCTAGARQASGRTGGRAVYSLAATQREIGRNFYL